MSRKVAPIQTSGVSLRGLVKLLRSIERPDDRFADDLEEIQAQQAPLELLADQWDRQIEADAATGKFDRLAKEAEEDFEAGRCTSLEAPERIRTS